MNTRRKIWIIAATLAAVTLVAAILASPSLFASYAEQKLIAYANSGPLAIDPDDFKLGVAGIRAQRLRLFLPKYLSGFDLNNVSIIPSWAGLFGLKLPVSLSAQAYSGNVDAETALPLTGSAITGRAKVRGIDLSQHPQLQGLGIAGGKLSADIHEFRMNPGQLPEMSLGLDLADLSVPRSTVLPAELTGQSVLIPRISHLSLSLSGEVKNNVLTLSKFALSSQFGEAGGSGTVTFSAKNTPSAFDMSFKLKPSEEGQSLITLLRTLLASPQGAATSPTGEWRIIIKGGARPRVELNPA